MKVIHEMANLPLMNRAFEMPADGWFQITRPGEYSIAPDPEAPGKIFVQVLDEMAVEKMVESFRNDSKEVNFPGLLVDVDHFSLDPEKASDAAGWIEEMQNRRGELWGKIRWTGMGEDLLKAGRYRMISPVWFPDEVEMLGKNRVRPFRLNRAGITNDPRIRGMVPLSNRMMNEQPTQGGEQMDYKTEVIRILGLKADAADTDIATALTAAGTTLAGVPEMTNRLTAVEAERDALKNRNDEMLKAQVDADLVIYKPVLVDDAAVEAARKMLMANRDDGLAMLRGLKAPQKKAAGAPLHNRATAKNPDGSTNTQDADDQDQTAMANRRREQLEYVDQVRVRQKLPSTAAAWPVAQGMNPDLFKED